jgi:hypothetical protein
LRLALLGPLVAAGLAVTTSADAVPADLGQPLACDGAGCDRQQRAWQAMQRASAWMARFPTGELRFDAAVMLSQIRTRVDGTSLRPAFESARVRADVDHDHPHRRFWDPAFRSPPKDTAAWIAPVDGAPRVNPNLVLSEALHCTENGFRPETTAYVCGAMRDHGGYHTTHGVWALVLARERGCVDADATAACLAELQAEVAGAQPETLRAERTLDVDLYGERLLMLVLSGATDPLSQRVVESSVDGLLGAQDADGSFGVRVPGEQAYHRFHATGIATWALAEWQRRAAGTSPDARAAATAPPTTPSTAPSVPSLPSR